eukprot:3779418-Rhodomonas_salina.2
MSLHPTTTYSPRSRYPVPVASVSGADVGSDALRASPGSRTSQPRPASPPTRPSVRCLPSP